MKFILHYIHVGKLIKREIKSEQQLSVLRTSFNLQNYPSKSMLKELAFQTGLSEGQVSKWFDHSRQRKRLSTCEPSQSLSKFFFLKMFYFEYIWYMGGYVLSRSTVVLLS